MMGHNILLRWAGSALAVLAVASCASTSVVPLSADTIQVTAQADPDCGPRGAQQAALKRAAVETLRRGFDNFVILGIQQANNTRVVGYTPVQSQTTSDAVGTDWGNSSYVTGRSTTTYSGGQAIVGGSFDQNLTVQMFRQGDPGFDRALSARATLGPNWQKAVASKDDDFC
ncbi:MAG TPA: hypothetical protein VNX29_10235 [Kaistia sp.]|nr:hypothetical protein [Kaistia sp.]